MYYEYGETELTHLRKKDKKLGAEIERIGMIKRKVNPNLFASLIESVIGQQISSKAAATVCSRLNEICGMQPDKLHLLTEKEIQACGMSNRKAAYIKNIANAYVNNIIDFVNLKEKSDRQVIDILTTIPGIGAWTAEMLLIFSLKRPNVISYGDLAIRRAMMKLYGHKDLPKERFLRFAKRYSPYASVASLYLWEISTNK